MSRKIDTSDPSSLTDDEIRYLQERDKLPAGVDPVMTPGVVNLAIPDNTGSAVTEPAPSGGNSIPPPSSTPVNSSVYDDLTVKELKDEVDKRNESRDAEAQLSKPSKKDDLISVLVTDDVESSEIIEE